MRPRAQLPPRRRGRRARSRGLPRAPRLGPLPRQRIEIVTAERIADNAEIRRDAHLNAIPSYRVARVVEAPWGAHPRSAPGVSRIDDRAFREYAAAGESAESFAARLDAEARGAADRTAHLEGIGMERLLALRAAGAPR